MASNAISCQGAVLQVSSGSGAALNITAITKALPCVVTSNAHGLANGDVVTIAAVGGMVELNGRSFTVEYCTTNTFSLKGIDSTGYTTYTSGGTATPVAFSEVGEFKSWSGPNSSSSELDVTNLASTAKEVLLGLTDFGDFSFDINVYLSDLGQTRLRTLMGSKALGQFKLVLPSGSITTATFNAYVKGMPMKGGVDKPLEGSVTLRITGEVVWS